MKTLFDVLSTMAQAVVIMGLMYALILLIFSCG